MSELVSPSVAGCMSNLVLVKYAIFDIDDARPYALDPAFVFGLMRKLVVDWNSCNAVTLRSINFVNDIMLKYLSALVPA